MKVIRYISYSTCSLLVLVLSHSAFSQDTLKKKTIEITSTFKPVLRDAAKLNFSAALPASDTLRPVLAYNIPQQHVKLAFQPGTLSPVALQVDSVLPWNNSQYLKVGIGNIHIPYIQGAFTVGDANTSLTAYAEFYTSKGKEQYQKNNLADIQLRGNVKIGPDHEFSAKIGYKAEEYFLYGFEPDTLHFTKSDLKQKFQTIDALFNFRNISPTQFGLSYNPNIRVSSFNGKNFTGKATEDNLVFNLPLQQTFGKSFGFNLGITADLTRYSPTEKETIRNNLYYVSPSVLLKTPNVFLNLGILPSWDNKAFNMLPNILAEVTTNDQRLTFQAGWIGYYDKGSYQRFAGINPWLDQPDELINNRITEAYAGFKGSLANHFTYSAKLAYIKNHGINLFVNDQNDGKTFETVYSHSIHDVQLHGEIGYMLGEEFSFKSGITYHNFTKISDQTRAWGLLPVELNGALRWRILKDLSLKADLFAWDGAAYRTKEGEARKGDAAFDLNVGLEFRITRGLDLWLQMNNIFNNKYERWNQYHVYGFNILGGVVFRFNQK
jgi:hypothetical protein